MKILIFPLSNPFPGEGVFLHRASVNKKNTRCTPEGIGHLSHYHFLTVYSHCLPLQCKHRAARAKEALPGACFRAFILNAFFPDCSAPETGNYHILSPPPAPTLGLPCFEVIISLPSCLRNRLSRRARLRVRERTRRTHRRCFSNPSLCPPRLRR